YADAGSHFLDLPGGIHLHYRDEGKADGPVLVLLHGYGDSFTSWEGWVAALKDRFRLISLDFPGHGLTRAPVGYYLDGDQLADLVDMAAARLQLSSFAVAGNSMGGGVAWRFAVRHPQHLKALILVDAAAFPPESPPKEVPLAFRILQYRWGRKLLASIDNTPLIDQGLKADVYDKSLITPGLVARWAEFQRAPGHRDILMAINPGKQLAATTEVLARIQAPTLVMHGEADVLIEPASSRRVAAAIPNARLLLYPQVGHLPQIEIPQRSAADVAEFLAGIQI
ncbi:MAG: alpha/beta hydrolase, partial [Proteobacteria bacterium]|nr:alpha/beta hydrolase [Pseudomonadota bacterium]